MLTQAQIKHRHSRSADGVMVQPALAQSTSMPVACPPPGRTASLSRGTAAAATGPDQPRAGSSVSVVLSRPSGSLGIEGRQSLAQSPPAKQLSFLRPADRPKPALKGKGSLKAGLSAAPLRPLSAGKAAAGQGPPLGSSSSLQGPPLSEQQPDRPLSASPSPPQQSKGKARRGALAAR